MTSIDLTGRTALVTGGAQGLGEGMASALASAGARVMIGDVQQSGADTAAALGDGHGFVHLDVTDDASWEAAVADTVGRLGGLDILVNNAGIEITSLLTEVEPERRPTGCSRSMCSAPRSASSTACGPCVREALPGQGGAIINVSSVAATIAFPGIAVYSATKSGGRPADPGRRDGGGQARLRRASQLHLPGPGADRHGRRTGQRRGRSSASSPPPRPRSGRHRPHPLRPARARSTTWRTPWSSSPPTRRSSSPAPVCRSTAAWGCERRDPHVSPRGSRT